MSKQLEEFKKAFVDFQKHALQLGLGLAKKNPVKLLKLVGKKHCDFSKSPWVELDTKTLADFKALNICKAFGDRVGETILKIAQSRDISLRDGTPPILNTTQWTEAIDSIELITAKAIKESRNNRKPMEIVLDFLKVCVNFLISLVTFGHKPNFFKSSTFGLEMLKQSQQNIHRLYEKLSNEEKSRELDLKDAPEEIKKGMQEFAKMIAELEKNNPTSPQMV